MLFVVRAISVFLRTIHIEHGAGAGGGEGVCEQLSRQATVKSAGGGGQPLRLTAGVLAPSGVCSLLGSLVVGLHHYCCHRCWRWCFHCRHPLPAITLPPRPHERAVPGPCRCYARSTTILSLSACEGNYYTCLTQFTMVFMYCQV